MEFYDTVFGGKLEMKTFKEFGAWGDPAASLNGEARSNFPSVHRHRSLLSGLAMMILAGCGGGRGPELPERVALLEAWDAGEYRAALEVLESGLVETSDLRMTYKVSSQGAFAASISGRLDLGAGADTLLSAAGSLDGQPVDLILFARGDSLFGRGGQADFAMRRPAELRDALIIGLTRMGILHNLARLSAGSPPDHAGGGVREWVLPVEVSRSEPGAPTTDEEPLHTFRFGMQVAGVRSGSAALTLRRVSGLPRMRLQEVNFPGGMMLVREEYTWQR